MQSIGKCPETDLKVYIDERHRQTITGLWYVVYYIFREDRKFLDSVTFDWYWKDATGFHTSCQAEVCFRRYVRHFKYRKIHWLKEGF